MKKDSQLYRLIKEASDQEAITEPRSLHGKDYLFIALSLFFVGVMFWIAISEHPLARSISDLLQGIAI